MGKKNQAALTSPKVATALFECSRIKVVSASHTCHLYLVSDPHTQTLALTQMWTHTHAGVCARSDFNTGVFVHSGRPVCADGEQIWSTWVSELWSRKWFLPWFGDEPHSCHPVIRQTRCPCWRMKVWEKVLCHSANLGLEGHLLFYHAFCNLGLVQLWHALGCISFQKSRLMI